MASALPSGGGPVSFGHGDVGAPNPAVTFVVLNTGTADLHTDNLSVPTGYIIQEGLDAVIVPGGSDTFTIELSTAVTGIFAGDISFETDDLDEGTYTFLH